ncbi:unnamed protein product [Urochloa humidicola]
MSSIVYMTCLFLSFFIHLVMIWDSRWIRRIGMRWRWRIACLSSFFRMSAAAALLLFLDTHHAVVVLPVLLLILVIVIGSYCWCGNTSYFQHDDDAELGINWGEHKEQLELRFHMSAQVVSMAFGGLSGKVLGFNKGSSVPTGGYTAVALAPEYILFYSLVLGLLVLLVCTVPPRVRLSKDRDSMATVHLRVVAYVALSLLVLASVVAALGIKQMQEYVFLECIAIAVIALIFYWYEQRTADRHPDSGPCTPVTTLHADSSAQPIEYIVAAYFNSVFAAIMASHSKYGMESGSTVPLSGCFKGFVLSAVCSILSFTIHIVLQAEIPYTKSWVLSRKVCSFATFGAAVTTTIFAILVVILRSDEFKSIF